MDSNRRLTPVAPPPAGPPRVESKPRTDVLKAPILIVTPNGQWEHDRGVLVIGRAPNARIVLDDPLVSREHARVVIQADGKATIEDLNSTNGVLINGTRLTRPAAGLMEGDRLLLGTTEISVFAARASVKARLSQTLGAIHLVPSSTNLKAASRVDPPAASLSRPAGPTQRADAGELVGRLAERLQSSGRSDDAVRVLSEHLKSLLVGAAAGLEVPEEVLDLATRYALRLYTWTQRSRWIDQAFELHLACKRLPSPAVLDALEAVWSEAWDVDRKLIGCLVEVLEPRASTMRHEEKSRLLRLTRLAKKN